MRLPRPVIVALVAVALFAMFVFANREPVRVGFVVTNVVMQSSTLMIISCALGGVAGFAMGLLVRRRPAR
jgi:membrane protein YqaA with SNARE-associated domain